MHLPNETGYEQKENQGAIYELSENICVGMVCSYVHLSLLLYFFGQKWFVSIDAPY